jgi:Sulfotransferase family
VPAEGISSARQAVQAGVQGFMQPIEATLRRSGTGSLDHSPVFIVGPPRTGSTLLYQLLVRRYCFCYFSNLLNAFPRTPLALAKLSKPLGGFDAADDFSSQYGHTHGWYSPNQGRECWTRWLPESPNALEPAAVQSDVKMRIRATVCALQRICGRPFVNKWPPNSVRVRLLADIFPQALFVRISRAAEPTVLSILRGRRELCQRGSGWFSVKPPGYRQVMKERAPEQQAAWQIASIERAIDADCTALGAERFFHVHYEDLTHRPRDVLDAVAAFYGRAAGTMLEKRCEIPRRFARRGAVSPWRAHWHHGGHG